MNRVSILKIPFRRQPRWLREGLPPVLLIVSLVLAWQIGAARSGLSAFILPTPAQVIGAAWQTRTALGEAVGVTLIETGLGLAVALVLGIGLAAAMDFSGFRS